MKRAIFDLIKKAKFFTAKGWKGKNAMMNDNLNARSPSAPCLFVFNFFRLTRWFMFHRSFDDIYHKSEILANI